jgi:DNA-binding transcriptional LysR family regulator
MIGNISDSRLRLLRIYKTVADCGGFTAAEVELNISRSAISIAIADLEQYLGFTLCQRGRAGFALTDEGVCVYNSILQLFSSMDSFRTQVNDLHSQLRGELNIGITDNMISNEYKRTINSLKALKQGHEQVRINISIMPPNDIERQVLDNHLHIGVIPELRVISGLDYISLYSEKSFLYCSNEHFLFPCNDITMELIALQDAVLPSYAQIPAIKSINNRLKNSASATDREGVAYLLLTGRFVGFLPVHYAKQWVDRGVLKALMPDVMQYETGYSVITNNSARPNTVRDKFVELLNSTDNNSSI